MATSIGMRFLLLKIQNLQNISRNSCALCVRGQHTSVETGTSSEHKPHIPKGQVTIPKRKKRDSVAVLRALASTVGQDETGAEYHFVDDPNLRPSSSYEKTIMALSRASGRKAARFMVNEYKHVFDHDAAVPDIPAFKSNLVEYKFTEPCNEALEERVRYRRVNHAWEVYSKMKQQGLEVSPEAQLQLLELLCVFNCTDPDQVPEQEEVYYEFKDKAKTEETDTIVSFSQAEEVFEGLAEKTTEAYNYIVRGLLQADNEIALVHLDEMKAKNLPVWLGTYNELFLYYGRMQTEGYTFDNMKSQLSWMQQQGLVPSRDTFHAVLFCIGQLKLGHNQLPTILAEMEKLGISPNLETWELSLECILPSSNSNVKDAKKVWKALPYVTEMASRLMTEDSSDYYIAGKNNFFRRGMEIAKFCKNSETAMLLFNLKKKMGIHYIPTNRSVEQAMCNDLLVTLAKTDTCSEMMQMYREVYPFHAPIPRYVVSVLCDNIDTYREYGHLLDIWRDAYEKRAPMANWTPALSLMEKEGHDIELRARFSKLAQGAMSDWLNNVTSSRSSRNEMTGKVYGSLMQTVLNNQELKPAWKYFIWYSSNTSLVLGELPYPVLESLFNLLVDVEDKNKIMDMSQIFPTICHGRLNKVVDNRRDDLKLFLTDADMERLAEL